MAFTDGLLAHFRSGSMLIKIIYVNVAVFVLLRLAVIAATLLGLDSQAVMQVVEVPSSAALLLRRPWTLLAYMVSHYGMLHLLFNMLWLYWLGQMFLDYFTPKQFTGLYVLGGLGGALLYVAAGSLLPAMRQQPGLLIGASAAVLAVVVAVAVAAPNRAVRLFLIGDVPLKWVAAATLIIDLLSIEAGNAGGHIAHFGGAAVGLAYGLAMRRGHDITAWLNAAIDAVCTLLKPRRRPRKGVGAPVGGRSYRKAASRQQQPQSSAPTEAEIDAVLDKIKRSGYSALTDAERDTLFRASSKRN